ncbi:hypothetical protein ACQKMN_19200 [Ureibacillus composti]
MTYLISLLFYVVPALILLWFMVNIVSSQRERNKILREIAEKLDHIGNKADWDKKGE